MKNLLPILFACLFISCGSLNTSATDPKQYKYFDENENSITLQEYQTRWRDKSRDLVRWDYIKDSKRVAVLKEPIYSQYIATYPLILKELESLTGRKFDPGTTFLIKYMYLNDLCSEKSTNTWNKAVITDRKSFTTPQKEQIETENPEVVVLNFFELGIFLENDESSANEYYFSDKEGFLRKNFFRTPSFCGSFALIKPDGKTLIRNGEFTSKMMVKYLEPSVWERFFPEEKE